MRISKFMTIRVPILLILTLTLLLFGCVWPFGQEEETNPNVEIIVPSEEVRGWTFSPGGDKIIYDSIPDESVIDFLLFLDTKQKKTINNCSTSVIWLDNTKLLCLTDSGRLTFVLATDDLTRVGLKEVETSTVDLEKLLQNAGTIYRYEGDYKFEITDNAIFILSADYKRDQDKNFKVIVENVDEILQGYDYITIPQQRPVLEGNEHSPNGDYYYILKNSNLSIYNTSTNKILAEYNAAIQQASIAVGGWAADSSGVYFQPLYGGGFSPTKPGAIMKLKVSQ